MDIAIQNITGTEFRYEILQMVGEIAGRKCYRLKNLKTGFICLMFEGEFEILKRSVSAEGN